MRILIFLLLPINLYCMQRQDSTVNYATAAMAEATSPFGATSNSSVKSEEDDLCDFAMAKFLHPNIDVDRHIRPFLKGMLNKKNESSQSEDVPLNVDILRRVRSGDNQSVVNEAAINEMVTKAIHEAFEEKEKMLLEKEKRIKEKYSGKKTASIAAMTGFISTIVTTICATLVTLNAKSSK